MFEWCCHAVTEQPAPPFICKNVGDELFEQIVRSKLAPDALPDQASTTNIPQTATEVDNGANALFDQPGQQEKTAGAGKRKVAAMAGDASEANGASVTYSFLPNF
jgi:hypothetical protein